VGEKALGAIEAPRWIAWGIVAARLKPCPVTRPDAAGEESGLDLPNVLRKTLIFS